MTKQNYYHKKLVKWQKAEKQLKRYKQKHNISIDKIIEKRLEFLRRHTYYGMVVNK